jgi:hypothetical protein
MNSRGDYRNEEMRMKVMNEGHLHHRYSHQEVPNRSYDRMRYQQNMGGEYMQRGHPSSSYRSQYDYDMAKRFEMSQYPTKNGVQMYPDQQMAKHMAMQNESMRDPKYNQMMNQERMMINPEYQRERIYPQEYNNTPSSIYMNKRFMNNFLFENSQKYYGVEKSGREERRLNSMRIEHFFNKLKLYYTSLKECLEQERVAIEKHLGQPEMLSQIKRLAQDEPQNEQLVHAVHEFCSSILQPEVPPIELSNEPMDDFNSMEGHSKIKSRRSKRKSSDESFSESFR